MYAVPLLPVLVLTRAQDRAREISRGVPGGFRHESSSIFPQFREFDVSHRTMTLSSARLPLHRNFRGPQKGGSWDITMRFQPGPFSSESR